MTALTEWNFQWLIAPIHEVNFTAQRESEMGASEMRDERASDGVVGVATWPILIVILFEHARFFPLRGRDSNGS